MIGILSPARLTKSLTTFCFIWQNPLELYEKMQSLEPEKEFNFPKDPEADSKDSEF